MENITFKLNETNIEQELNCVVCLTLPSEPLQCQGCDSIMCKECSKSLGEQNKCPLRCQNPNYGKVKPKTMMLFDHLELRCEKCLKTFKCLEFAKHKPKCGRNSSIFALSADNETNESPEQSVTKPFDHYRISNSKKKPAKVMTKKTDETDPEPLYAPLILNDNDIQINQIDQVIESENRSCDWYFLTFSTGLIAIIMIFLFGFHGINTIFIDSNLTFKWICIGNNLLENDRDLCFIAIGAIPIGIITIGLIGVGLFTFSLLGIGLLFGLGIGIGGCGLSVGMFSVSFYTYALFGMALYRMKKGVGMHFLYALLFSKDFYVDNIDCLSPNLD